MKVFKAGSWMPWVGVIAYDAPNADGGAGGGGSTGSGGDSSSSEGSTGADGGAGAGEAGSRSASSTAGIADADDDSLALDDLVEHFDPADTRPAEERIKALARKNRQLFNRAKRNRSLAERLNGVDVDQVLERARNYETLQRLRTENPKEFARVMGQAAQEHDTRTAAGGEEEIPDVIDMAKLPFDPEGSDVNRFLAGVVKQLNALNRENVKLRQGFDGAQKQTAAQARTARATEWKSQMDAAAATMPDGVKDLFLDTMRHAFRHEEDRRAQGHEPRTAAQLVAHYTKRLNLSKQQQQRASDAARQQTADKTAGLPRQQTQNGSPTGAGLKKFGLAGARDAFAAALRG